MAQRQDGYEDLNIDTTYGPFGSGDKVWIQRHRKIVRQKRGWATVAFVCDHRWPDYSWHRMVSVRRYRYVFGRWKEKAAINIHADDVDAIAAALKEVDDVEIGERNCLEEFG